MLPISPRHSPRQARRAQGSPDVQAEDWAQLTANLGIWLKSMQRAQADGRSEKVLKLMEALVSFMGSSYGAFLQIILAGGNVRSSLYKEGAPKTFVDNFMDVMNIVDLGNATLLHFGAPSTASRSLEAAFLGPDACAQRMGPRSAPASASGRADEPLSDAARARSVGAALCASRDVATISSLKPYGMSDAVTVSPDLLPPEVISGLSGDTAVPFLIVRWITHCYAEVLFCVEFAGHSYVCGRKLVYVGCKPGTQLDGRLALADREDRNLPMLEGTAALPWHSVAGLLHDGDAVQV